MKIGIFSFTEKGGELGDRIRSLKGQDIVHHRNREVEGGIKAIVGNSMSNYDALVFVSATGIAIRMVAPYLKDKTVDPAIIAIDDLGRFTISLLSGHIGGANDLALIISKHIGSIPIITTASDLRGFEALDLFAKKNDYIFENKKDLTKIMTMMVNGKSLGFYSEEDIIIDYSNLTILKDKNMIKGYEKNHGNNMEDLKAINKNFSTENKNVSLDIDHIKTIKDLDALIIISSKKIQISLNIPYIILRPKNINIGIGCKKGIPGKAIIAAIEESLDFLNLSSKSIKSMATVEIKKDEEGIIEAANQFSCPLEIYSIEEIRQVEYLFQGSQFVKDTIGVSSVSEPCAYLLGGEILLGKSKHKGITVSIAKE